MMKEADYYKEFENLHDSSLEGIIQQNAKSVRTNKIWGRVNSITLLTMLGTIAAGNISGYLGFKETADFINKIIFPYAILGSITVMMGVAGYCMTGKRRQQDVMYSTAREILEKRRGQYN